MVHAVMGRHRLSMRKLVLVGSWPASEIDHGHAQEAVEKMVGGRVRLASQGALWRDESVSRTPEHGRAARDSQG